MKLITETLFTVNCTSEINEATKNKKWYIEGVFAEQEQKNRNGRIYPAHILEREMAKYQQTIADNNAVGELNHPEYPMPNPKEICHRVTELSQNGNDWHGKSLVLEGTQYGDHIIAMIKNECRLGVSTRGMGSVKVNESKVAIIQEDYCLNCWDVVLNPSANKAFVNGIMEGTDWAWNNGVLVEQICDNLHTELSKGSKADPQIVEMNMNQYSAMMFNDAGLDSMPIKSNTLFERFDV